ncbi:MAG TPA: sugar phosphate isomerase/epimerase [Phycisphaerae bacterium]|nr:sugar phosphate isomerase/epimerase [Phycisphaerae bacterium]
MKPISVQLYSVREAAKTDFFGVLKQIASFGYAGVEPAGLHGKDPKEIRKVLDDLGMVCSSTHGPLVTKENLSASVDTAKALGYTMLIAGWKKEDWLTLDGIKRAAEAYEQANAMLRPHGLRMGYHNHWWEMDVVEGKHGLEHFLSLAPNTFAEIDTYWASNFGKVDAPAFVKKWASRAPLLHIKDGPLVQGKPHTAVGGGKMNVPAVVQAADEKTLQWLVVELDECATDMLTAVKQSCEYLVKNKLGKGR